MHRALYRKYRPSTFDGVCGQNHITDILKYEVVSDKISHAYLFCGSRGTGKTSCAKIMAKAVNCENPQNGSPCLKCNSCLDIEAGITPDVVEMDAASHNGVDEIRSLCDEIVYAPAMLKKRVYIIDEVHMLSQGAFNALLKTIEEPPEHAVFILATTEMHKVPATIVSRCQRFDFHRIEMKTIADRLLYISKEENIKTDENAALLIARQAQGGMRDAIGLLELCAAGGADVTEKKAYDVLGVSGYEKVSETFAAVSEGNMGKLFDIVDEVSKSSKDISVFWQELVSFVRDMLVSKYAENAADYLDLTKNEAEILKNTAAKFSLANLVYMAKILDDTSPRMSRSPATKRIIAEMALLKLCRPELDTSNEAFNVRLTKLENAVALGTAATHSAPEPEAEKSEKKAYSENPLKENEKEIIAPAKEEQNNSLKNDDFVLVEDISEALEKLAQTTAAGASFFSDADVYVSKNRKTLKITTGGFAATMLDNAELKTKIASAFAITSVTDGIADIIIEKRKDEKKKSPSDDFNGLL